MLEGKPKKEEVYKNGLKEGTCKEYYEGGKIKSEITYKEGIMDGQYKSYYKNGQISYEGKYTAGKDPTYLASTFDGLSVLKMGDDQTSFSLCQELSKRGNGPFREVKQLEDLPISMYELVKDMMRSRYA